MKTIKAWESFKTIDGRFQFYCMKGVVQDDDGQLAVASWKKRTPQYDGASALAGAQPLQVHDRGPVMRPEWTRCPVAEAEDESLFFVKRPSLLDYIDKDLDARIAREITVCEALRGHRPQHRNLAAYHGCCVSASGRVDGVCFRRYRVSLLALCNPGRLNKRAFVARGPQRSRPAIAPPGPGGSGSSSRAVQLRAEHLDGLLSGVRHLHGLGLVHNDITPANIMVDWLDRDDDDDDSGDTALLVLIDFDSCRPTGASLPETQTRRTHGWHDPAAATAQADNDLHALAEVRTWLFGDATELQWEG